MPCADGTGSTPCRGPRYRAFLGRFTRTDELRLQSLCGRRAFLFRPLSRFRSQGPFFLRSGGKIGFSIFVNDGVPDAGRLELLSISYRSFMRLGRVPRFPSRCLRLQDEGKSPEMERPPFQEAMTLSRFELLTFRLGGGRSIQLSYRIALINIEEKQDNFKFPQLLFRSCLHHF